MAKDEQVRFHGAPVVRDDDLCPECAAGKPKQLGVCPKCGESWSLVDLVRHETLREEK